MAPGFRTLPLKGVQASREVRLQPLLRLRLLLDGGGAVLPQPPYFLLARLLAAAAEEEGEYPELPRKAGDGRIDATGATSLRVESPGRYRLVWYAAHQDDPEADSYTGCALTDEAPCWIQVAETAGSQTHRVACDPLTLELALKKLKSYIEGD